LKTLVLDKLNSDSAVPGLNRDRAYSQKFFIAQIYRRQQQQIASILSSLDDKIEFKPPDE
jgi:type I restriction enzyme S subunit